MNKEEYLIELERNLRRLPEAERLEAMQYYREYFEDAGDEVQAVIDKLGSPKNVANGIIRECATKSLAVVGQGQKREYEEKKRNSTATDVWLIILGIFAAPIAFPVAIAIVAILFAVCTTLLALCFSVVVLDVCFFIVGICAFVAGIAVISVSPTTTLFFVGCSLFMIGFGIMAVIITIEVAKLIIKLITWLIAKIVNGGKKNEKEY